MPKPAGEKLAAAPDPYRCTIQVQHGSIHSRLIQSIHVHDCFSNLIVDMLNGFQDAFSPIATFIAITQFQCFVNTGGSTRRHSGLSKSSVLRMIYTSTVGLPRESNISRAWTCFIWDI
jgi:hypothetical protein